MKKSIITALVSTVLVTACQTRTEMSMAGRGSRVSGKSISEAAGAETNIRSRSDAVESQIGSAGSRNANIQQQQPMQIRFNALPQPVQDTIRARSGDAQISEINRKTIYEVKFSDRDQKLWIRDNGTVINEK